MDLCSIEQRLARNNNNNPPTSPDGTSKYAVIALDDRLAAKDHDDTRASQTFLPRLIYRNVSDVTNVANVMHAREEGIVGLSNRYKQWTKEPLTFNLQTFVEEFVTHTGNIIFGPLFAIPAVLISGRVGAKITGFWPGAIEYEGKKHSESTQNFVQQNVFYFLFDLPLVLGLVLYMSGIFVNAYDGVPPSNATNSSSSSSSFTIDTEIFFVGELVVTALILMLRQIVIAVKYAYIPRAHIRNDREAGRNMDRWGDEIMVPWCIFPNARQITHNTRLACERARIDPFQLVIEFAKPFGHQEWRIFDTPETIERAKLLADEKKAAAAAAKLDQKNTQGSRVTVPRGAQEGSGESATGSATGANGANGRRSQQQERNIDLWRLLHYSVWHGSHNTTGVGLPPFLLMGLFGAFIPPMYRAFVIGRPAFGKSKRIP